MQPLSRVTAATVDVLRALRAAGGPEWGLRIIKSTGRPAGTVYPILERLERAGWITAEWEEDSDRPGPRRRYYRFTAEGARAAAETCAGYGARPGRGRPASGTVRPA